MRSHVHVSRTVSIRRALWHSHRSTACGPVCPWQTLSSLVMSLVLLRLDYCNAALV